MKNVLLLLFVGVYSYALSSFSEPKPTFDEPRKVVFQLYDSNLKKVNNTLSIIYNILKEYPTGSINISVISYGNGVRALRKDYDNHTLSRIKSLMEYEVEFIVCKNTMETQKWLEKEFIDELNYVQAGIVELIEKQIDGYIGINAY